MQKISDNFKNLFFVNVSDEDYKTIHSAIYSGTFEEVKAGIKSVYGGNGYTVEISQCVSNELPCFEDEI